MLTPGAIPTEEPTLRIGIVLPEDNYTSIELDTPQEASYQIEFMGRTFTTDGSNTFFFKRQADQIHIQSHNDEWYAEKKVKLYPVVDQDNIGPKNGVKIKNVISGRSFHWKKYINVYLPGTIIIQKHGDELLVINELPLEQYLMCVATSEMGRACPPALLEAQTITARSWMLANVEQKHRSIGIDVCNDDCCQRYQGSTFLSAPSVEAARNTHGQVLMYDDQICDARYSKSCGGVMESFEHIWPGGPHPYLQIKADAENDPPEWQKPLSDETNIKQWLRQNPQTFCSPAIVPEEDLKKYLGSVDEAGKYFRWRISVDQKELTNNLNRHFFLGAKTIRSLKPLSRGGSGRINRLQIQYENSDGKTKTFDLESEYNVRLGLHPKFLYSSAVLIEPQMEGEGAPERFVYTGGGWGHGVGLCQIGALGMALSGYATDAILEHYYPGSRLKKIYSSTSNRI